MKRNIFNGSKRGESGRAVRDRTGVGGIDFPYLYGRQKSLDWINPVLSEADCLFLVACMWYLRRDKAAFQWQGIEYDPAMQI